MRISTVLTMTLLLGSALNAAATPEAPTTPRSAAAAWIAEKASGKTPTTPASEIHKALHASAAAAATAGNPERILELWRAQQAFTKESGVEPSAYGAGLQRISPGMVHEALHASAAAAPTGNLERILELWRAQQAFTQESGIEPGACGARLQRVYPGLVHEALHASAAAAATAGNPERILELWRAQQAFTKESGIEPAAYGSRLQRIYPSMVHQALHASAAAKTESNPERMLELWRTQQAFSTESYWKPEPMETIFPSYVHQALHAAAATAGNLERILELWRAQQAFSTESNWKPEHRETIFPSYVHQALHAAAATAKTAGNTESILELWRTQQAFSTESNWKPEHRETIFPSYVHQALHAAADAAKTASNPERMLELWRTQQAFSTESNWEPEPRETIFPSYVHQAFSVAVDNETNSTRIVTLFETWADFVKIEAISSYERFKRPDTFKAKYDAAKKEVEASRSLVPAASSAATASSSTTAPGDDISIQVLVGFYGSRNIIATSLTALRDSFSKYYKTAVLRLHPDKSPADAEEFKILQSHKAWVDSLTETTFAASAK